MKDHGFWKYNFWEYHGFLRHVVSFFLLLNGYATIESRIGWTDSKIFTFKVVVVPKLVECMSEATPLEHITLLL